MLNFSKFFLLLIKFLLTLTILAKLSLSYADQLRIEKVKINGAKRLSESFILNFLPEYPNTNFNNEVLNKFTKDIYNTGMFDKVSVKVDNYILLINVVEYPIINEISFTGNDLLDNETLSNLISINSRDIFNKNNLSDAIKTIKVEYQKIGRYLAQVNVKKIEIGEGRVNINFEIDEGALLVVKNINFIGNKNFSDSELKSKISTKEDAWYKIFGSNKFIPERLYYDKEKLREFYNQRGYLDFTVKVARGDLLPNFSGFNINFIISEGQRFSIDKIKINTSLIDDNKNLLKELYIQKGEIFNSRALDESTKFLIKHFESSGFSFVKVLPSIKKRKNLIDISYNISEGSKKFINKIIILGNTRTNDSVIRRELSFLEGDPFNKNKLDLSINSIKRLGFFETVNYRLEDTNVSQAIDVIIEVKEMNTGSVSFGVGYSSLDNTTLTFGLREKNFLGEGKNVRFETSLSDQKSSYNIGVTEPYFLERHLSLSGNIFDEEIENKKGDVKTNRSGVNFGVGFKINDISQAIKYNLSTSETTTSSSSTSASETGEEGKEITTSSITYGLFQDTRDNYFNPTSGYRWGFDNTIAGIGGDAKFYKTEIKAKTYYPIEYGDYVLGFKTGLGLITAIEDNITSSNRFFLGGKTLRGFDKAGVGPRDTGNNQAIGGNNYYNVSFELKSDKFMPDDTGLEWFVFSDIGSIWGTDYKSGVRGYNDKNPRITNGFGLSMITPVGPLQMIWGFPLQSETYDIEENFQFSIGTSF
ncbi:MAG: outer membrane protein assembly factor BamA [Alphaproteobacteria bacterium TMED199]|nr:MAG: outer membrane protein assembly factor BamA [Alphaproteobacteria bacterium TMED199]